MTPADPADRPAKAPGLVDGEVVDGMMVLQEQADRVHHLNPSAAVIFELCDGERTVEQIAAEVGELYGLPAVPLEETQACVAQLQEEGLVLLA